MPFLCVPSLACFVQGSLLSQIFASMHFNLSHLSSALPSTRLIGRRSLFFFALLTAAGQAVVAANSVVGENQLPGTKEWLLDKVDAVVVEKNPIGEVSPHFARSRRIEGFANQTSYAVGDDVKLLISTDPVSHYTVDIYRLGYYQGLGGRHMLRSERQLGLAQPTPEDGDRNVRECAWTNPYTFRIPPDWVSGVYLAKLARSDDGIQSYAIFVVKDARKADFNLQVSDVTWQAYNRWPEWRSLYDHQDRLWQTTGGDIVSFDRPFTFYYNLLPSKLDPLTNGSGEFLQWEFPLVYWMEQQGYDVTYTSGLDTHNDASGLLRTRGFISVGHDEYWTRQMFDHVARARDAGVNLLFLSGNAVDGEIFLTTSSDGRPNRIMGRARSLPDEHRLMGATSYGVGLGDWIVTRSEHWLYEGTGLQNGDVIADLVGWEYHGPPLRDDPTLIVVGTSKFDDRGDKPESSHSATFYDGGKGNFVFNAGTCWWSMPLARPPGSRNPPDADFSQPDTRVQRMTRNLLDRVVNAPVTP
jgi:hypothetical protein